MLRVFFILFVLALGMSGCSKVSEKSKEYTDRVNKEKAEAIHNDAAVNAESYRGLKTKVNNILMVWNAEKSQLNGKVQSNVQPVLSNLESIWNDLKKLKEGNSCATKPITRIESGMGYLLIGVANYKNNSNVSPEFIGALSSSSPYVDEDEIDVSFRKDFLKELRLLGDAPPMDYLRLFAIASEQQIKNGVKTLSMCN